MTRAEHCSHCSHLNARASGGPSSGRKTASRGGDGGRGRGGREKGRGSSARGKGSINGGGSGSSAAPSSPGGLARCSECNFFLRPHIDYGSLTDTLVWVYLFEQIGIPLRCNDGSELTLADVLWVLPSIRGTYSSVDYLGHDFFKLQCYYLTHFIYVMSDWGAYPLRHELYAEEIQFMCQNMLQVIRMNDPELVSEFVQCLKIFQIGPDTDPECWRLVRLGMNYLVDTERCACIRLRVLKVSQWREG